MSWVVAYVCQPRIASGAIVRSKKLVMSFILRGYVRNCQTRKYPSKPTVGTPKSEMKLPGKDGQAIKSDLLRSSVANPEIMVIPVTAHPAFCGKICRAI